MNGLLIIDKPAGMTSFDVVRRVRRLLHTRRIGHAGTLDPMATGVLPLAVGDATRLLQFVTEGVKTYRATVKFGEITDTQDAEGTVLERRSLEGIGETEIAAALRTLTGTIRQVPPMYSALKHGGVPLYRLARQGIEVERAPREVTVHRLDLVEVRLPLAVFEVDCSKGTYVRTLAHDLGLFLGCGAHLVQLRRTRTGQFDEADAITLERFGELVAAGVSLPLLAPAVALSGYTGLAVGDEAARRLANGIPPANKDIVGPSLPAAGEIVSLSYSGRLLAVARYAPGRDREKRGDFELLRVLDRVPCSE